MGALPEEGEPRVRALRQLIRDKGLEEAGVAICKAADVRADELLATLRTRLPAEEEASTLKDAGRLRAGVEEGVSSIYNGYSMDLLHAATLEDNSQVEMRSPEVREASERLDEGLKQRLSEVAAHFERLQALKVEVLDREGPSFFVATEPGDDPFVAARHIKALLHGRLDFANVFFDDQKRLCVSDRGFTAENAAEFARSIAACYLSAEVVLYDANYNVLWPRSDGSSTFEAGLSPPATPGNPPVLPSMTLGHADQEAASAAAEPGTPPPRSLPTNSLAEQSYLKERLGDPFLRVIVDGGTLYAETPQTRDHDSARKLHALIAACYQEPVPIVVHSGKPLEPLYPPKSQEPPANPRRRDWF